MTKQRQFSNEFNVLYSRENNPWVGGGQYLISSGACFPRVLGQEQVAEASKKQGMIG